MKIEVIKPSIEMLTTKEQMEMDMLKCEMAARTCYKSEVHSKEGSAGPFVQALIKRGHESIIEHGNATVKFIGDRSMSHQLVRHRLMAISQESQRYCNYGNKGLKVICPPTIADLPIGEYEELDDGAWMLVVDDKSVSLADHLEKAKFKDRGIIWLNCIANCYQNYLDLGKDVPNEDARSVLPNATKTEVVVTANFRQWRHMIKIRGLNPHAQWQIRMLMQIVLRIFADNLPHIFGDLQT